MRNRLLHGALAATGLIVLPGGTQGTRAVTDAPSPSLSMRSAEEKPKYGSNLSVQQATIEAHRRGFTFYWPRYWPHSLPSPRIRAYMGTLPKAYVGTQREGIVTSAEKHLQPAERPTTNPHLNSWRRLMISLYNRNRTPREYLVESWTGGLGTSPPSRDAFHEDRVTGRAVPVTIRGHRASMYREPNSPNVRVGWIEGDTYILVSGEMISDVEVVKTARSLRPIVKLHSRSSKRKQLRPAT